VISLAPGTKVCLACRPVDLRNGFDGLAAKAQQVIGADPFSGHLFIFRGKRGDYFKGLYWDGSGMWLIAKRLEKGRFVSYGLCQCIWTCVTYRPSGDAGDGWTRSVGVRTPGSRDGRSDSYAGVGYPMMTVRRRAAPLWPRT